MLVNVNPPASQLPPLENEDRDGGCLRGLLWATEETTCRKGFGEISIWECELFARPVVIRAYFLSCFPVRLLRRITQATQGQGAGGAQKHKSPHSHADNHLEDEISNGS